MGQCSASSPVLLPALGRRVGSRSRKRHPVINEELCTGCTRCNKACPTDAIVGATKQLHVVYAEACTGCKQCVDTCPEDCISLVTPQIDLTRWHWHKPEAA